MLSITSNTDQKTTEKVDSNVDDLLSIELTRNRANVDFPAFFAPQMATVGA